jgi:hypothetical protein
MCRKVWVSSQIYNTHLTHLHLDNLIYIPAIEEKKLTIALLNLLTGGLHTADLESKQAAQLAEESRQQWCVL